MIRGLSVGGLRAFSFFSRLAAYFAATEVKTKLIKDEGERTRYLVNKVHVGSRDLIKSFGFEVKVFGYDETKHAKNFLTISNHMSYMDVFLLASVHPTTFVTSVDMGETPVLGHVTRQAGCIFVERRNRTTIEKDVIQITEALQHGINVTIYPEGTSSDGQRILPFKKALFTAAVEAGVDVLPVVLKYTEIDGEPFSNENKEKIAWYGDMGFAPHFLQLMATRSLKCEIHFLDIISVTKDSTRQELAQKAEQAIRDEYMKGRPTPPEMSFSTDGSAVAAEL